MSLFSKPDQNLSWQEQREQFKKASFRLAMINEVAEAALGLAAVAAVSISLYTSRDIIKEIPGVDRTIDAVSKIFN